MQKGMKQLLVLCGAAVVLGGAYAGLTAWNTWSDKKKSEEEKEAEEAAKIYLSQMENVDKLSVTNPTGSFSFTYNEEEETWSYDKDEHFPVKQSEVTSITSDLEDLTAVRKFDEPDELSVYGLDEPAYEITASYGDSESVTMKIGNSSTASGDYYLILDGDSSVYTVSSSFVDTLLINETDLLNKESFPSILSNSITSIQLEKDGTTSEIYEDERETVETEEATEETETGAVSDETETESESETAAMENYWTRKTDTGSEEIDEPTDLLTAAAGITFDDCADYYLEDSEAASYGLAEEDNPAVLTITYRSVGEETQTQLLIGSKNEDGSEYYVKLKDSNMVNTVSTETIDSIFAQVAGEETDSDEEESTEAEADPEASETAESETAEETTAAEKTAEQETPAEETETTAESEEDAAAAETANTDETEEINSETETAKN